MLKNSYIPVAVCSAFVVSISACVSPSPARQEIAGNWVGSDGASLQLNADGTLVASNIPEYLFLLNDSSKPIGGRGNWRFNQPPGRSAILAGANWWDLEIAIESFENHPAGARAVLHYSREDKRPILFFWKGEEGGERFEFRRIK